jgi:hypothetical protein
MIKQYNKNLHIFLIEMIPRRMKQTAKTGLAWVSSADYTGLVREPGWFSHKSCKMLRILMFFNGSCSETEVSEQP